MWRSGTDSNRLNMPLQFHNQIALGLEEFLAFSDTFRTKIAFKDQPSAERSDGAVIRVYFAREQIAATQSKEFKDDRFNIC